MHRHLLRTGLNTPRSLLTFQKVSFSKYGGNLNLAKFKTKQTATDTRYYDDGDNVEETPRGVIDNTLINVNLVVERIPVVPPMPKDWELEYHEYTKLQLREQGTHLPESFQKTLNAKIGIREPVLGIEEGITKDDETNNYHSLHRCLHEPLYLIFKVEEGTGKNKKTVWQFPRGEWRKGETVRQTAERAVFYYAGETFETHTLGNAPIAYHPTPLPPALKKQFPEAKELKNFYMHSMYLKGPVDIEPDSEVLDYAWVAKSEFPKFFTEEDTQPFIEIAEKSLFYNL